MSENLTGNVRSTSATTVDGAMAAALFEVASEVSVLRDRLYAAEQLLQESDALLAGAIDSHEVSGEMATRCDGERKDFINRILQALAGKSTASQSEGGQ